MEGSGLAMRLKDLATPLWLLVLLAALELTLELRAHRRDWETLLLGPGPIQRAEAAGLAGGPYGPRGDFPFWGPVHHRARTPGVLRIWVASTSHAAPMDVPKDHVFPTRMEAECQRLGRPCEVLNASEPGLLVDENTATLRALGPTWRPDVVVLYQMANDISASSAVFLGGGAAPAEPPPGPSWVTRTTERTTTWILIKTNLTSRLVGSRVLADDLGEAGEARYLAAVERLVAEAEALGARPVLVTFALSHRRAQRAAMPEAWVRYVYSFNMHLSIEGWMDTVARLNAGLVALGERRGVPVIDLDAAVGGQPELFSDLHHFKWEGHDAVAAALTQALLREHEVAP